MQSKRNDTNNSKMSIVVVVMLAAALILLAAGLVIYPLLIVSINNVLATTTTTLTTTTTTTAKPCADVAYERWQDVCYLTFPIINTASAGKRKKRALSPAVLRKERAAVSLSVAIPVKGNECPGPVATYAYADTDKSNARVQGYIDSKGPGRYYINAFKVAGEWYSQSIDPDAPLTKVFWSNDNPVAAHEFAMMSFKTNGLWFSQLDGKYTTKDNNAYVICELNQ